MDLRTTFDEDAERYDTFRPSYPSELVNKLISITGINSDYRLLEIGPGTGQATKLLAGLGAHITAVELGSELAEKARQNLRDYPNTQVITDSFEHVVLPEASYDLIYSATAFHWVDDAYKFTKTASLLKPKGYLAVIHTEHISDGAGDAFYKASKPIYDNYWPPKEAADPTVPPSISDLKPPFIDTNFFTLHSFSVFPAATIYSAHDYSGLLSTYSPVIALPPTSRQKFLSDIQALITHKFSGQLQKHFAFTLTIAQKI